MIDRDFDTLENILPNKGQQNNIYVLVLSLLEEHRGSEAIKALGASVAQRLLKLEKQGIVINSVFGEAVSPFGAKSLSHGMGMKPINGTELDGEGRGFYTSSDNLHDYNLKMTAWRKHNQKNPVLLFALEFKNKLKKLAVNVKNGKTLQGIRHFPDIMHR